MRRAVVAVLVTGAMVCALAAVGCGQKAASSSEAIQHAQTLQTPQEQADYLIGQAKVFLDSKNYQEATATARYVLAKVDHNSQQAKELLQQAAHHAVDAAQAGVKDAKKQLGL